MEYLETVVNYLSRGTDKVDEEDMRRAEGAFPFTRGEIMPTIAEKWIEQGVTKGIQQGTLQMVRGNIIEILEVWFDAVTKAINYELSHASPSQT